MWGVSQPVFTTDNRPLNFWGGWLKVLREISSPNLFPSNSVLPLGINVWNSSNAYHSPGDILQNIKQF